MIGFKNSIFSFKKQKNVQWSVLRTQFLLSKKQRKCAMIGLKNSIFSLKKQKNVQWSVFNTQFFLQKNRENVQWSVSKTQFFLSKKQKNFESIFKIKTIEEKFLTDITSFPAWERGGGDLTWFEELKRIKIWQLSPPPFFWRNAILGYSEIELRCVFGCKEEMTDDRKPNPMPVTRTTAINKVGVRKSPITTAGSTQTNDGQTQFFCKGTTVNALPAHSKDN